MITGDSKITAQTIAAECGIVEGSVEGKSFTGTEFEEMSHKEKLATLGQGGGMVFSRVEPKHKRDIVKVLSELVSLTLTFRVISLL